MTYSMVRYEDGRKVTFLQRNELLAESAPNAFATQGNLSLTTMKANILWNKQQRILTF